MSANWANVENAIQAAAAAASGLAGARVVWQHQNRDGLTGSAFLTLNIEEDQANPFAEQISSDTPGLPAGNEVTLTSVVHTTFDVVFDYWSMTPTGATGAAAVLRGVRNYFQRDSVNETLFAAGVAVVEAGAVQNIPRILETVYESRAQLRVTFRVRDSSEETTTFIETVEWTTTLT
jgi:hypothetical protein